MTFQSDINRKAKEPAVPYTANDGPLKKIYNNKISSGFNHQFKTISIIDVADGRGCSGCLYCFPSFVHQ